MKKYLFSLLLKWYCFISNKAMWYQRNFLKCREIPEMNNNKDYLKAWEYWDRVFGNMKDGMNWDGFDYVLAPERFLELKCGNSDSFALFARIYFSHCILTDYDDYLFDGLHFIKFKKGRGNVIAVWKAIYKKRYFIVDCGEAYFSSHPYTKYNLDNVTYIGILGVGIANELYFIETREND